MMDERILLMVEKPIPNFFYFNLTLCPNYIIYYYYLLVEGKKKILDRDLLFLKRRDRHELLKYLKFYTLV